MRNLSSVQIGGNLVNDPETKIISGKTQVKFTIACNHSKKDASFFDVEAWEKTGDIVNQYCKKGSPVIVIGMLKQDRWKNQEGQTRSKIKIIAREIILAGTKSDSQEPDQKNDLPDYQEQSDDDMVF